MFPNMFVLVALSYKEDNVVDVVELLLAPTDQALNVRHLRVLHTFSSMTSLELLIQQSVEGEFRQHDGVVTVMVK